MVDFADSENKPQFSSTALVSRSPTALTPLYQRYHIALRRVPELNYWRQYLNWCWYLSHYQRQLGIVTNAGGAIVADDYFSVTEQLILEGIPTVVAL